MTYLELNKNAIYIHLFGEIMSDQTVSTGGIRLVDLISKSRYTSLKEKYVQCSPE